MFEGEFASLEAIEATNTVRVPKPIKVLKHPEGGSIIVMEYLDLHGLSKYAGQLGLDIARMHLHNEELRKREQKKESSVHKVDAEGTSGSYVDKFGFHVTTCCGFIPQDNSWTDDWPTCFTKRLKLQLDLIEKDYADREASSLAQRLYPIIPRFFDGIEVVPSLLHGDLWGGNAAQILDAAVVFDPASFYGHHEYELAIAQMFGGFFRAFFSEYHSLVPKASGHSRRLELYKLFHYLNHWNHFGTGYRGQSISIMKSLVK